jgi:cytochrome c5
MARRTSAIFFLICTLAVTAAVVAADLKKGYYTPAQLGSLRQASPDALAPDSVYQVSAYPVPALELAAGDGRQFVQIHCNTCHSPRYITMQPPLPAADWQSEVNKMIKTYGANIPDDDTRKIIDYLQAHYAPDTRKE